MTVSLFAARSRRRCARGLAAMSRLAAASALPAALLTIVSAPAMAATVERSLRIAHAAQPIRAAENPFTYTFTGLAPTISDGTLSIKGEGDFDSSGEYLSVSADGYGLGQITPGADRFIRDVTITQTALEGMLTDGALVVRLVLSPSVNQSAPGDFLTVRLRYEAPEVSVVPLPGAGAALGAGLGALVLAGRRRR
ncbi:hypothetical protein [Poseidonocella sedimentorum]|uniref:VPLPA-CTERM protein sorting domain-containing protein n=1 Tax=Poseidonocella sedimentorum TaxID=871652 RepID=A0A1I6CMX1_9RHOB|nr:hypothetical protein [Poseidonocella sedimentorum]SFQ94520.1 hypothetical protein SAMN04515673_10136 [Poseidonocella sedimentorum]